MINYVSDTEIVTCTPFRNTVAVTSIRPSDSPGLPVTEDQDRMVSINFVDVVEESGTERGK